MTLSRRTTSGEGVAELALRRIYRDPKSLIVHDARAELPRARERRAGVVAMDAALYDVETIRAVAAGTRGVDTLVAVGGGSVMDLVKLAAVVADDPKVGRAIELWGKQHGAVVLPQHISSRATTAIPTTFGTASEVSAVACLAVEGRRRLVMCESLRPDRAVLDGTNYATLGQVLVQEGAFEVLSRLVGAGLDAVADHERPHRIASVRFLYQQLMQAFAAWRAGDGRARLHLAMISSETAVGPASWMLDPFASQHWYIANEVADYLGLRKMQVTPSLMLSYLRLREQDERLNTRSVLSTDHSSISASIGFIIDQWGLQRRIMLSEQEIAVLSRRIFLTWAGSRRVVRMDEEQITTVLRGSTSHD